MKTKNKTNAKKEMAALDKRLDELKNPPFAAHLTVFKDYQDMYGFFLTVKSWAGAIVDCGKIEWQARYANVEQAEALGLQIAKNFRIEITGVSIPQELPVKKKKRHYKGEKDFGKDIRGWTKVIRKL